MIYNEDIKRGRREREKREKEDLLRDLKAGVEGIKALVDPAKKATIARKIRARVGRCIFVLCM